MEVFERKWVVGVGVVGVSAAQASLAIPVSNPTLVNVLFVFFGSEN